MEVDDTVIIVSDSTCGLEDCITSNYVRLKIFDDKVLTCLSTLGGGSVVECMCR